MFAKPTQCALVVCMVIAPTIAAEDSTTPPIELQVLKDAVGVWDAEIEVWPGGTDSPSIKFRGVETNHAYGKHWIASDFDSEFDGQATKVHSIVGYDLDKKQMVGTIIDHGPYAAKMTGEYDHKTKTVTWITKVKAPSGEPIVQKTLVTQKTPDERVLVLMMPKKGKDEFSKFMQIRFVRRR